MTETSPYVTFGKLLQAYAHKGWQKGSGWSVNLGNVMGSGASKPAALNDLAVSVQYVCEHAYDKGYLVQHEDGSLTVCQWFGTVVSQTRIRDGRVVVTSTSDWKSPKEAAEDAIRECAAGPGRIVRL